jgi:hypothetical protein
VYYWAVSANGADGNVSPLSDVRNFTLTAEKPPLRTIFPPDNYTLAENLLPDTIFIYKSDIAGKRMQISRNADFSSPEVDEEVSGDSYRAQKLSPGIWYWRVSAQDGSYSAPAQRLTVLEALPAPELETLQGGFSEAAGETHLIAVQPGKQMEFRWRPVEGADYYKFRLYDSGGENGGMGDQVFSETSADTSLKLSMSGYTEGAYYWSVQPLTNAGPAASQRTGIAGISRFELRNRAAPPPAASPPKPVLQPVPAATRPGLLPAAQGLRPADKYVINAVYLRDNSSITFSWNRVGEANAYIFTLFRETAQGRQQILSLEPSGEIRHSLTDLSVLGGGNFIWQVEAVQQTDGAISRRGTPAENRFTVDIPAPQRMELNDLGAIIYGK